MAEPHGLDPVGVVEAVVDGVQMAVEELNNIQVNLLGIISRTYGVDAGFKELDALLSKDSIVGLDLAGDEVNYPQSGLYLTLKERGRWLGICSCWESAGTQSVWNAINKLGACRSGHALSWMTLNLWSDAQKSNRIEVNLTSNWHTNSVAIMQSTLKPGWIWAY